MQNLKEELVRRFYAIPFVTRIWSVLQARNLIPQEETPFTPLRKPLKECRVALVTTGGLHLPEQTPFDMENPDGDATFRRLPAAAGGAQIQITHKYYDHSAADQDINVIYPIDHLRNLVESDVIGSLAEQHYSLMGHIEGESLLGKLEQSAATVAGELKADQVDAVLLTPA